MSSHKSPQIDETAQARVDELEKAARAGGDGFMGGWSDVLKGLTPVSSAVEALTPGGGQFAEAVFPVYKNSPALAKRLGKGALPMFEESGKMSAAKRKELMAEMEDFIGAWYPKKPEMPEWLNAWKGSLPKAGSNAEILGTVPQQLTQSLYQSLKQLGYGGVADKKRGPRVWEDVLKFEQGNPNYLPKAKYPSLRQGAGKKK